MFCVKHNIMLLKTVLFCCLVVICNAQSEAGDQCTKDGRNGICIIIHECRTAVADFRLKKKPLICGFIGPDPIVCCLDYEEGVVPRPLQIPDNTITKRPDEFENRVGLPTGCADIAADWTQGKTGQKAFDKCVDYQEAYVYPCEKSVTLSEDWFRGHHCFHDATDLFSGVTTTSKYEFPHVTLLGYGESVQSAEWLCAGSIISERYILTAAHCSTSPAQGDVQYVVTGPLNRLDTKNPEKLYSVETFIKHPQYLPPSKYNDIAVVKVDRPILLLRFLVPACLDVGGPVNDSSVLAITWGASENPSRKVANTMQKVILQKFSPLECSNSYPPARFLKNGFNPQTQSCYASRHAGKDTCQGDSGSAILIKSKLLHCMYIIVGVTSLGRGCGDVEQPAIYTRVATYVPWIESVVWP